VAGLTLLRAAAGPGRVTFAYGTCVASGDCRARLTVSTVPTCSAPAGGAVARLGAPRMRRGVPSGTRGGALVLLTGRQEIRVRGDAAAVARAVALLRAGNRLARTLVGQTLPPPARDAARRGACPVLTATATEVPAACPAA
jgi:hypothetical protein